MGSFETILLTIAIIAIDIIILKEYLRLEEELVRTKALKPPTEEALQTMAQEVVAQLPEESNEGENAVVFRETETTTTTTSKQANQDQALTDYKKQTHTNSLDAIGLQIDKILKSLKNTRKKVVAAHA